MHFKNLNGTRLGFRWEIYTKLLAFELSPWLTRFCLEQIRTAAFKSCSYTGLNKEMRQQNCAHMGLGA